VNGRFFEHIYGFLIVVEQVLKKYAEKELIEKGE
jgi:hypothetical protein